MENTEVQAEAVVQETVTPIVESKASTEKTDFGYSAEDLSRARAQEKEKLYPQLEKLKEELATLKKERDEKTEQEERARLTQTELAEKKIEEDMDIRQLLEKKEKEFQAQLEAERLERERAFALLDQEKHFQEVMQYRQQKIEQERENIIPELLDLVDGNSRDEIEQSIASLKDKSARILDSAQQALQSTRREMAGTRVTSPASGPLDNDSEQRSYSPESIREMSLADYAKQRAKLLGEAAGNRGKGLFG